MRILPTHIYNLNYLIQSSELQFHQEISPLLAACYVGKIEVFLILLNNECIDLNLQSEPDKYSPLMLSCYKGFYEITRMLLERGAEVALANTNGQYPFVFCFSRLEQNAYKYENRKICMMLIDLLLSHGADINVIFNNETGYTMLMKLCMVEITDNENFENLIEIIKFLIERGADPNCKCNNNQTVYDLISPKTPSEIKQKLIEVFNQTKQTLYLKDEAMPKSSMKNIKKININNTKDIVFETNDSRTNCCAIY